MRERRFEATQFLRCDGAEAEMVALRDEGFEQAVSLARASPKRWISGGMYSSLLAQSIIRHQTPQQYGWGCRLKEPQWPSGRCEGETNASAM